MTNDTLLSASPYRLFAWPMLLCAALFTLSGCTDTLTVSVATALWKQAKLAMTPTPTQKMAAQRPAPSRPIMSVTALPPCVNPRLAYPIVMVKRAVPMVAAASVEPEDPAVCQAGECVQCEPQCGGLECGNDGCGGSCGDCGLGEVCQSGSCVSDGSSACAPNPCENGGICTENAAGVPECECPDDFVGDNCETPVALQDCNVDLDRIGDGICENSLNILACLYDGGDCCESTCSQDLCEGASDSTCFDPAACENIPTCDLKCEDVSCATPPAPYCQDGLVVTFASEGTCRDGACSYTPTLEACADGTTCTFGACRAAEDTCADLTCDTPSTATCSMTRPSPMQIQTQPVPTASVAKS